MGSLPSSTSLFYVVLMVFSLRGANGLELCKANEREALLQFENGVTDLAGMLSSWSEEADCCKWRGVSCNNHTGHVIELDLRGDVDGFLFGPISPSLMELRFLESLDLSGNAFDGPVPTLLGSFKQLRYLNLSSSFNTGGLPQQLGNLSNLQVLDLSSLVNVDGGNCEWLSKLSSLSYLNMENMDLNKVTNLFQILNEHLPYISYININSCNLPRSSLPSSFSHVNFTMLTHLDVGFNSFEFKSPHWLSNITSLEYIDLSYNPLLEDAQGMLTRLCNATTIQLASLGITANLEDLLQCDHRLNLIQLDLSQNNITGSLPAWLGSYKSMTELVIRQCKLSGPIPEAIGDLRSIEQIVLSNNTLNGSIPSSIGRLNSCTTLDLSNNQLTGEIPESIGQLCSLTFLDLDTNHLQGIVTERHFSCHSRLIGLDLSSNSLELRVPPHWTPPFKNLSVLSLSSCKLGPKFPLWIQTQQSLSYLYLSNTSIQDALPQWMWSFAPQLSEVDLSMNGMIGTVPYINGSSLFYILLHSNKFHGPFPNISTQTLSVLSLSNNSFAGRITLDDVQDLRELDLSLNRFNGTIPSSLCTPIAFDHLDLSSNDLSGQVPACLGNSSGYTCDLTSLHLNNNNLEGTLPESLKNCRNMSIIDVGNNRFTGSLPTWIANMSQLNVIRLRSNLFSGHIPQELSYLSMLQVLDLADNDLSGNIPISFGSFSAMRMKHPRAKLPSFFLIGYYTEKISVVFRGQRIEFDRMLSLVTSMDLSANKLHGEVPKELGNLHGLINLNLSCNSLTGSIPNSLSNISQLESLDLSRNNLSGSIPATLSSLNSLSLFNVSFNNLTGEIPSEGQFGTFSNGSYLGDSHLCGKPLNPCTTRQGSTLNNHEASDGGGENDRLWLFIAMAPGFIFGFWIFWGSLLLKKKWRFAYFRCVDKLCGGFL